MISSKRINWLIALLMSFALLVSAVMVGGGNSRAAQGDVMLTSSYHYGEQIFGSGIIDVQIIADQSDWDAMLAAADKEQYYMVDVIVNGTKCSNVGIRLKGNSSLNHIASDDTTNRYSFRIKFDKYIKGQTCLGLDSLVLNNLWGDTTYMKDYLTFDLMNEIGVDTPYYGFSNITVNGQAWGFYGAFEAYQDSFLERTYGDSSGHLYSAKRAEMGNGGQPGNWAGEDGERPKEESLSDTVNAEQQTKEQSFDEKGFMPQGEGMAGMDAGGADLVYVDDEPDSYSNLFQNAISSKSSETDFKRVIAAIKALNDGENIEQYWDVDQILRYLAVHTIVVNLDSYSSNMCQNYMLYEKDGQVTVLPWDYGLAFGGLQANDALAIVNFPIDTPVSGTTMEERPLLQVLLENEEYLETYHNYLAQIMAQFFDNGKIAERITQIDNLIKEYVQNDVSAFQSYDEYQTAVSSFITLLELRAESINGQLVGAVPATTQGQEEHPELLISADQVNLTDLGDAMGQQNELGQPGERPQMQSASFTPDDVINRPGQLGLRGEQQDSYQRKTLVLVGSLFLLLLGTTFVVSRIRRRY